MMKPVLLLICSLCFAFGVSLASDIQVVHTTDVVVVGGSSSAVAAALAAKEAGANVFLVAPRPYLGEDIAGTLRIVREKGDDIRHPLFKKFFNPAVADVKGLTYTYTTDLKPNAKQHSDSKGDALYDGLFGRKAHDSVQYDGDVTITADLGTQKAISNLQLDTYVTWPPERKDVKNNGAITKSITVSFSSDAKTWSKPQFIDSTDQVGDDIISFIAPINASCRYVRIKCQKDEYCPRQLLTELIFYPVIDDAQDLAARTTPFIVKRVLDKALLDAKIPYLTGSIVCDVLKDSRGAFAGVVMANRSGRQIVRAKVMIDATPRGYAARLSGGKARAFDKGIYDFHRIVISGEKPSGKGVKAIALTEPFVVSVNNKFKDDRFPGVINARIWDCEIKIAMKDGSARSFAEAEQIARDLTYNPTIVEAANKMTLLSPDRFICQKSEGKLGNADNIDLKCFQLADISNVYVIGPMADLTDEGAKSLMKSGISLMVGSRVGRAAAAVSKNAVLPNKELSLSQDGAPVDGALGEHFGELPSYLVNTQDVISVADKLPVLAECDTVVIGAGTGGGPAGIAAARHGARTIICEYLYVEGGVQTDGLIGHYYSGNRIGFTKEIDDAVGQMGSVFPLAKSEWYRSEQRKAGAEIWFGAFANGVIVKNNSITSVVVVLDDGTRGIITCKNAIDATGNAELPAMAGELTEFITDDELSLQGAGYAQHTLGTMMSNADIGFVDDTDAADVFYFALRSRLSLPINSWDQAQVVNSRERRRMIGAFYMTAQDVVNNRTYPDVVLRTKSNFDTHGQTKDDLFFIQDPGHHTMFVNMPYRCLLPKKLDGLLVTGLGVSAHRDAMPILRMQPDIQNQGYVAGTAAAMAASSGVAVRNVDIKALQRHLCEKNILREEDLSAKDNFPLSDSTFDKATENLSNAYKGLPVLMTDISRAIPRLRAAYEKATGESKLIYEHVLAMFGQNDGEATLIEKLSSSPWDKGWNYRGMGQFNRSVSWIDSYVIALGHCKSRAALPALIAKANELTEDSRYSHFRSIAKALEEIGDPVAIPVLANVLRKKNISGHWQIMDGNPPIIPGYQNPAGDRERTRSLREICIARALYRLGDTKDKLARRTLEAYVADPRRSYANHAKKILSFIPRAIDLNNDAQRKIQPSFINQSTEGSVRDGLWMNGRWCYRFHVTKSWFGELPQWPCVNLKPAITDWTAYDRFVIDVFNDAPGGDMLSLFIAEEEGKIQDGLSAQSLVLKDYGYQRWIVDLKKWPEKTNPAKIGRIHFFYTTPTSADVHISGFYLLRPGDELPPVSESFLSMKVRPSFALAEKVSRERHRETVDRFVKNCRSVNQDGCFAWVGKATSMQKVRPRDDYNVEGADNFSLKLARGEYESLQVLVMPNGTDLTDVTVEMSVDGIPSKAFKTSVVGYVQTTNTPPYRGGYNVEAKKPGGYERKTRAIQTGWWPDPILDYLDKADIKGDDLQSFWVRLKCPEDQKAGTYSGSLKVKGKKGDEQFVLSFPLTVRVYNFSVPKKSPLPLAISFHPEPHMQFPTDADKKLAKKLRVDVDSPINQWRKHKKEWANFLADHYITITSLYHNGVDSIYWDELMKLKEEGRLGLFNLGYWEYPWSMEEKALEKWKSAMHRNIDASYQKAKELGLLEHAYLYGCDEIKEKYFENIAYALKEIKIMFPGVPIHTTAYDHEFGTGESKLSGMDWFTPITGRFASHPEKVEESRKLGHQVWWYIACWPHAPNANMFVEYSGIEARQLMGAQTVKYRPDGFLYYQVSIWNSLRPISGTSAFTDWDPRSWMMYHGDGSWFCCGPDGMPCETIRMENFRDGLEDYAYALEYERLTGKKCEVPVQICRSLTQYTDDPKVYYAWRDKIAELIEQSN